MDTRAAVAKDAGVSQHFSMLSKTKLGSAHHASSALTRKAEVKRIVKYYEQLKPWQQKLMVSMLIRRCSGPELEKLNDILKVLSHRDFQASFNKKYPVEAFRSKIDSRKAKTSINKLFEKLFTHKVNWRHAFHSFRSSSLKRLYMRDRLQSSTPLYYSTDTADFSVRIQEAVARILREQRLPVVAYVAPEEYAVSAEPSIPHVLDRQSLKSRKHSGKHSLKHVKSTSVSKPSSKYRLTDIAHDIPQELEEQELLSEENQLRAPVQGPQSSSQGESATIEIAAHSMELINKEVDDNSRSSSSQDVSETLAEGVPLIPMPVATQSLPVQPADDISYIQHYPSAPAALGMIPDGTLTVALSTSLPTLSDGSADMQLSTLPASDAVGHVSRTPHTPPSDQTTTVPSSSVTGASPPPAVSGSDRPTTQFYGQWNSAARPSVVSSVTRTNSDASTHSISPDLTSVVDRQTAHPKGSYASSLLRNRRAVSAGAPRSRYLPGSMLTDRESIRRAKSMLQIDRCESSFLLFEYGASKQQLPAQTSRVTGLTKYETHLLTREEQIEDDDAIKQFRSSVYDSLRKSKEHISNEDDLAEAVAECILSSTIGLALLSTNASVKISRSRFLNLRDRMSSEVMQATMKVFHISPPGKDESLHDLYPTADRQVVEPFSPRPDPVLEKIEKPMTYFKRHPGQQQPRRLTNYRRRPGSSATSQGLPARLKTKSKLSKKGKPTEPVLFDKESELPRLDQLTTEDLCSLKSGKFSTSQSARLRSADSPAPSHVNRKSEFLSQLNSVDQLVGDWTTSDIVRLLEALISHAYERGVMVLPLIVKEIRGRVTHVTNITDLPDRLLVTIFQYLDVSSLQSCQEVCRRWAFLCTRAEIWLTKCDMLGRSYGITKLCERICDKIDGVHTVDWQMAYRELSVALHRYENPVAVHLHPAVLASKGYSSCVAIADWNEASALPPIALDTSASLSTPQSTLIVSDLILSGDLQTDSSGQAPAAIQHTEGKPPRRRYVKKSRFPPLKLMNNMLVLASDSPAQVLTGDSAIQVLAGDIAASYLKKNSKAQQVKARNSYETAGSESLSNAGPTLSLRHSSKQRYTGKRSALSENFRLLDDASNDLAMDIRTDLIPAKHLHSKVPPSKNELAGQLGVSPMSQHLKTGTSEYDNQFRPAMSWFNGDDYSLRDPNIAKRFRGYVKSLHYVHKFKGHTDVIYCCDFDRNRVFTGGMDGIIYLWDKRSGRMVEELKGHNGSVRSLVLHSVKDVLYSASWDTTIFVWDVIRMVKKTSLWGHTGAVIAIRLDESRARLFSASSDGTVRLWCTRIYRCMQVLDHHSTNINCLFLGGATLASGGADGKVNVYSRCPNDYKHVSTCSTSKTLKDVTSVSNIVMSSGQHWDQQTRDKYLFNSVTSVYAINDLVLGGTNHGEMFCWCRKTSTVVARFDLHIGSIIDIHLWCQRILTAGSDGMMKEWELGTMTCVRKLQDHANAINCAKVNDACDTIVSVGDDKLIHVWHFKAGKIPKSHTPGTVRSLPAYALDKRHSMIG